MHIQLQHLLHASEGSSALHGLQPEAGPRLKALTQEEKRQLLRGESIKHGNTLGAPVNRLAQSGSLARSRSASSREDGSRAAADTGQGGYNIDATAVAAGALASPITGEAVRDDPPTHLVDPDLGEELSSVTGASLSPDAEAPGSRPRTSEGMSSILSGLAMAPANAPRPPSSSSSAIPPKERPTLPSLRPATLPSLKPDILPSLTPRAPSRTGSGVGQGEPVGDAAPLTVPPGAVSGGMLRRRVSTSGKDV